MTLETWRHINFIFIDILLIQLCLSVAYMSIFYRKLEANFKIIYFYIFGNLCFDIVAKIVTKVNINSLYFTYQDYFFIFFECYCLYTFFYGILQHNKWKKTIFGLSISIIIIYLSYDFLMKNEHYSRFFSTLISLLNSLIILCCLYELTKKYPNKKFTKIPEAIICIMFLVAYASLMFVFFLLPYAIEYSRILANQIVLIRQIIGFIFTFSICYALKKSIHYH